MRNSTLQIEKFEQVPSQRPQVQAQVAARPVALAPDNLKNRQLESLQNALGVFSQGVQAYTDAREAHYEQTEIRQAIMDFAEDPEGFTTDDKSLYYYLQGMDLKSEKAAIDLQNKLQQDLADLMEDEEAFLETDLGAYIEDFLGSSFGDVEDPIVMKRMLAMANNARGMVPKLQEQQKTLDLAKREEETSLILEHYASNPESLSSYMTENMGAMVERLGREGAAKTVANTLARRMSEAQTSSEAQAWLNLYNQTIPNTKHPETGKALTIAQAGGEELANAVSKAHSAVLGMADREAKEAERLQQEALKEAERAYNKWENNVMSSASRSISKAVDDDDLVEIASIVSNNAHLTSETRQALMDKIQDKAEDLNIQRIHSLEDPATTENRIRDAFSMFSPEQGAAVFHEEMQRLSQQGNLRAVSTVIGNLYSNLDLALPTENTLDGSLALSEELSLALHLYPQLTAAQKNQIPTEEARRLAIVSRELGANGGDLHAALSSTVSKMELGEAAFNLHTQVAQGGLERFTKNNVKTWFFGSLGTDAKGAMRGWAIGKLKGADGNLLTTDKEVAAYLQSQFEAEFSEITDGFTLFNTDKRSLIHLGDPIDTGARTYDYEGQTFHTSDLYVESGFKEMRAILAKEQNAKNVIIAPSDFRGNHIVSWEREGEEFRIDVSVADLDRLGRVFKKERTEKVAGVGVSNPRSAFKDAAHALLDITGRRSQNEEIVINPRDAVSNKVQSFNDAVQERRIFDLEDTLAQLPNLSPPVFDFTNPRSNLGRPPVSPNP